MNAAGKLKISRALLAPHLGAIREELRDDLGAFLAERLAVDDEGNVGADPGQLVTDYVASHPVVAAAAAKTANLAASATPSKGEGRPPTLREAVATALAAGKAERDE